MCYKQYIQVTVKPIYRFRFTKKTHPPLQTVKQEKRVFVRQISVKSNISAICPLEQYMFQQKRWVCSRLSLLL